MNKDFQLNENARFIFPYNNHLYRVSINIINGLILLEEIHNTEDTDIDIKGIISIPYIEDKDTPSKVEALIEATEDKEVVEDTNTNKEDSNA